MSVTHEVQLPNGKQIVPVGPTSVVPTQVPIEDRVLERLLSDPAVDPARVRDALELRKEIYAQRRQERLDAARENFFIKLGLAQSEMKTIVANRKGYGFNFADYDKVEREIRPIYTKYGFSVTYNTRPSGIEDYIIVTAKVTNGLHTEEYESPPLLADGKGPKDAKAAMTKTQAAGGSMTYGQRYLARLIWNLTFKNDILDVDAPPVADSGYITAEQAKVIRDLLKEGGADEQKFLQVGGVSSIEQIPTNQYDAAVKKLKERNEIVAAKKKAAEEAAKQGQIEGEKLVEKAKAQKAAKNGVAQ